jgi:glycosyltransferase involved in cell wall biosynthesis
MSVIVPMAWLDVIICVHSDTQFVPGVLSRLREQSSHIDIFRVLFVDNASTDDGVDFVERHRRNLDLSDV